MVSVNDLRQGAIFQFEGSIFQVKSFRRHKMARAKAIVQLSVRDVENSSIKDLNFKSGDSVEEADVSHKNLVFVYYDKRREVGIFSDPETNKRIELDSGTIGRELLGYLKGGIEVTALIGKEEKGVFPVYSIDLPKTIDLIVTQAPPADKGNTASGGSKSVEVETGITLHTPFFIKTGDIIKVNTETGEYVGRVNE